MDKAVIGSLCVIMLLLVCAVPVHAYEDGNETPALDVSPDRTDSENRTAVETELGLLPSWRSSHIGLFAGYSLNNKVDFKHHWEGRGTFRASGDLGASPVVGFQWVNWKAGNNGFLWGYDILYTSASGRVSNEDHTGRASINLLPFTLFGMFAGGMENESYPPGSYNGYLGMGLTMAYTNMHVDFGGELGSRSLSYGGAGLTAFAGASYNYSRSSASINLRYMYVSGSSESISIFGNYMDFDWQSVQVLFGYLYKY